MASLSAVSLPCRPQCAGTQRRLISRWEFLAVQRASCMLSMTGEGELLLSAIRTDRESEQMRAGEIDRFIMQSMAFSMAFASAIKISVLFEILVEMHVLREGM